MAMSTTSLDSGETGNQQRLLRNMILVQAGAAANVGASTTSQPAIQNLASIAKKRLI